MNKVFNWQNWVFRLSFVVLVAAIALISFFSAGVGGDISFDEYGMAILTYPDFENTPDDKNSWEYLNPNEDITLTWYVDVSTWAEPSMDTVIGQKIKEKTGVTIDFETPVNDDGSKLSTMIAGGDLADIVTLSATSVNIGKFAKQGYVYDINGLADRWAPSFYSNFREDVMNWWKAGNGKTYGVPNHYYSYEDVPDGTKLQPNGGMMVRKDIFNDWQDYIQGEANAQGKIEYESFIDGSAKSVEWQGYITTPEGFLEAAKWALEQDKYELTTGLQLNVFSGDGNTSLEWLSQFFAIPYEDKDGNYLYKFEEEEYKNMLLWLNEAYNTFAEGTTKRVISDQNFSANTDAVGTVIANARAFATLVTPQSYQYQFNTAKESLGKEYVSMYITNFDGDAPILQDVRGYGYLYNMVSTSCERPDIAIKLIDFLTSEEGQRLVFMGVEGDTWEYSSEAGNPIKYTQKYLEACANETTGDFGFKRFDMLVNYQYYDNVRPKTDHGLTESELYMSNLKRPLSIFAYDYNAAMFSIDSTLEDYSDYSSNMTRIKSTIAQQLPSIIKASSRDKSASTYDQTIDVLYKRGLELIKTMNNDAYQKAKETLGIESPVWPAYKTGFTNNVNRLAPNGDTSYYKNY